MKTSTPMEKIKAYHSIKPFISEDEQNQVANMLNLTNIDLTKRIEGKDAEFEFLLMCHLLGKLKDVIAFEEGASRLTNTTTTDFLFITHDDRRLAIEVKSTIDEKWKISNSVLSSKEDFAKSMNAELYFALKINKHWIFLSSHYIREKGNKITFQEDRKYSALDILGEKTFGILKPIAFKSLYNRNPNNETNFENLDWGFLTEYSVEVDNVNLISSKDDSLFYRSILEAVQRFASSHSQEVILLDKNKTLVIEKLEAFYEFKLSHFLLAPIKIIAHDLHWNYDLTTYVTEIIDNKEKELINSNMVVAVLNELHEKGLSIIEVRGTEQYPLNKLYQRVD